MDIQNLKDEAVKLAELLRQADYRMINFKIECIQPGNDTPDIHIWARFDPPAEAGAVSPEARHGQRP